MKSSRSLRLAKERLGVLSADDLLRVGGGYEITIVTTTVHSTPTYDIVCRLAEVKLPTGQTTCTTR